MNRSAHLGLFAVAACLIGTPSGAADDIIGQKIAAIDAAAAGADASAAEPGGQAVTLRPPNTGAIVKAPQAFTDDDLMLFEVHSGDLVLSDGFTAYSSRAGVFLPVGELARLLDLAIDVDPQRRRAKGWVVSQTREVLVDLEAMRAEGSGQSIELTPLDVVYKDDEIFLSLRILERILPIRFRPDTASLILTLTPTEPLPFQERLAREQTRNRLGLGGDRPVNEIVVNSPYRLFTPPSVDVNIALAGGTIAPRQTQGYDVRAAGDFAGAGLQLFAGSDQDGELSSVRVLAERKDPDGRNAGPFGARRSSLGDTFSPAMAIGARSMAGRGVAISSQPLEQASVFNRIDLRGELPLGYEVELYVNEVLRGSQREATQGRYEFSDVNLVYGLNVIRLVFYGPRGERREEVQRLNVGGGQLAAGQTAYTFGAVEQEVSVIPVQRGSEPIVDEGDWRVVGGLSHGLTNTTTISGSFARYTPIPDDTRWLGTLGLSTSIGANAVQFDVAADDQKGEAYGVASASRFGAGSLVARHVEYSGGFIDEVQAGASAGVNLRRSTNIIADALVSVNEKHLPLSLQFQRNQFDDGRIQLNGSVRVSRAFDGVLMSSSFTYTDDSHSPTSGRLGGVFDVSAYLAGGWQARGALAYSVTPDADLSAASISLDRNTSERSALHFEAVHSFDSNQTLLQAAQTWRTQVADLALTTSYNTGTEDFRVGLQLSFGLAFDPLQRRYRVTGPGTASGGSLAMDAFIDQDGDGRRGPGEPAQSGVKVMGGRFPTTTDDDGHALITHLGDGATAVLSIDPESLEDPYLLPPATQVRLIPRPGRVAELPYPLASAGEVELLVQFRRGEGQPQALSAVQLELLDASGKVVAMARTEYDGVATVEALRAGAYRLRIQPEQAERLKLRFAAPVTITIPPGGGFIGRINALVVARTEGEAEPVAAAGPIPPALAVRSQNPVLTGPAAKVAEPPRPSALRRVLSGMRTLLAGGPARPHRQAAL